MVVVLLDGVDITALEPVWVDPEIDEVGVLRRSADTARESDEQGHTIVHTLYGRVRFAWSGIAADMTLDTRRRLAALYPEVVGLG